MKIDQSIDYDALLEEAKSQHAKYKANVDQFKDQYCYDPNHIGFPKDIQAKVTAFYNEWLAWIDENITSKGLHLHTNILGAPCAISTTLAGEIR